MKRKWWKLKIRTVLLVISAVVVVGAPVAYFGGKYILRQRTQGWKRDGIAAAQAGEHERAADLLYRYLRRIPRDEEALGYFVKSRELAELPDGQHISATVDALKLLVSLNPDRIDDQRHLLELYAKIDRRPEAIDLANAILKRAAGDTKALSLKTEVLLRQSQDREALEASKAWLKAAPQDVSAHLMQMTARLRIGHSPKEILDDVRKLQEANPDDPGFELLLGAAFAQSGDTAQAAQWLKTAAGRPNLTDDFVGILVAQFDMLGMSEDALNVLHQLVQRGASPLVRQTLAKRLWEGGKWEQVVEVLADLDPRSPKSDPTLVAFKAISLVDLRKPADADACRAALAERKQAAARAWTLLLRRMIDGAAVDDKQLGAECRAALMLDPRNGYLDYFLGDVYARLGERDLAIGAWQRAVSLNPAWAVPATRLVEALLQKGRPEQAFALALATARRSPSHAGAVIALARAWSVGVDTGAVGHANDLLKLVTDIQSQLPGEDQTLLIGVQLVTQKGQKDEAVRLITTALERKPPANERLLTALAMASRKLGLGLEAKCFEASEKAHGITPLLAYGRAIDALSAGTSGESLKLFDELATRSGKANDVQWRLARARFLDLVGGKDAHDAWVALGDAFPKDITVQQSAASARATFDDWDFQLRTIDRLRDISGERGLAWRLAKARLYVGAPRNAEDSESGSVLLTQMIREYPTLSEPRVLLARALVQMGRTDGAIEHLTKASEIEPYSVPIALQLAALLQSRGDFERVRGQIDRVKASIRTTVDRQQAARVLAAAGEPAKAAEILEKDTRTQPQSDLMLALLYRQQEQWDKADATFKKLLDKPELPVIQQAALFYASRGRFSEADKAIAMLDGLKLQPGVAELIRGDYLARLGHAEKSIEQFHAATEKAKSNPAMWRALIIAQYDLVGIDPALASVDQALRAIPDNKEFAAIKQQAALLREASRDRSLKRPIVAFLGDPLNGNSTIELIVLLQDGYRAGDRERLATRLQQFADSHPGFLPARIQLARVYREMGRNADALAAAKRAATSFPNSAELAELQVQLCAASGKWDEMIAAAETWRKRLPGDTVQADVAIAQAQIAMKQPAPAVKQLAPHLPVAQTSPDRYPEVLTIYSIALAHSGQARTAADLLWPLAEKHSAWRNRWINVSLAMIDGKEAIAWLERVAAIVPAEALEERAILAEAYENLGTRLKDPNLSVRSKELARQNTTDPKADAPILLAAAVQAERNEDFPAAESLYRRALAKNPDLWLAQNNLAMLLITRNGDANEAVTLAAAAVKSQPTAATLHDTLAQAQSKSGNHNAAAETMRTAIRLDPDNPKWRIRMAQYQLNAGDTTEAAKTISAMDSARINTRNLPSALQQQLEGIRQAIRPRK